MGLTGDLSRFKMGDLFQTLEGSRQNGVLKVWRQGETREVYFGPQGVSLVNLANACTERLAERFRNVGEVNADDVASAKRHAETHGSTLGQVLVQRNLVSGEAVERAVREQAEEMLYDMFGWAEGNFEFFDDKKPEANANDPFPVAPLAIGPALFEGARRLDEWTEIERQVPDRGEVFVATALNAAQRAELSDDELLVLEAIDGRADLRVLADRTLGTLFETAKVVAALADREYVRLATLDELIKAAETEFAQNRRESARQLLDLAVDRRAPRLRRNLNQISDLYQAMDETERACNLRSFIAGQLIAAEKYDEARDVLEAILQLLPEHLNSNKRLLQVIDEVERDSAAAFAQRTRVVEILNGQRDCAAEAQHMSAMLSGAPPRDVELLRRAASAAAKAGVKECALSLLHFAAEVDRESGLRPRLIETYREILKLDRGNKEILDALRQLLISQQARRKQRIFLGSVIVLILGVASWWLTGYWNGSNAAALLQASEEAGRTDAQAGLLALQELEERYNGSLGAADVMAAAATLRQSLQRRLSDEKRRKDDEIDRVLSSRLAEAGGHVDAQRYAAALPIYRELLKQSLRKEDHETIRFRIQLVVDALLQWDTRLQGLLDKGSPEHLARCAQKDLEPLRQNLTRELSVVDDVSIAAVREAFEDAAFRKVAPANVALLDEHFYIRVGVQRMKGELLQEELEKRLEAFSRTDELESILANAEKAERDYRFEAAAELYTLLAQSSVEGGLQQQFLDQAKRLGGIVEKLGKISAATAARDFQTAVDAYRGLADDHPELDLRGRFRLPFLLRSLPAGAEVREGSEVLGHTPLPVEFDPFRTATLILVSEGFEPEVMQLGGFDRADATLVLKTTPLWRIPGTGPVESAPLEHSGVHYFADRAGHVRALNLSRRAALFDQVISKEMGGLRGSPFTTPRGLAVVSWEGQVSGFDPVRGTVHAEGDLEGEGPWIGPVKSPSHLWHARGNHLYLRALEQASEPQSRRSLVRPILQLKATEDGALIALQDGRIERHRSRDVEPVWVFESNTTLLHLIATKERAFVFAADGTVVVLDAQVGTELSRWKLGMGPAHEPLWHQGHLYVPMTREVMCLEANDGREILRWTLAEGAITAPPSIDAEKHVLLLATDKGLEVLDLEKPRTSWRHVTPAKVAISPVVTNAGILIALSNGALELLPRR